MGHQNSTGRSSRAKEKLPELDLPIPSEPLKEVPVNCSPEDVLLMSEFFLRQKQADPNLMHELLARRCKVPFEIIPD
jgi:hypothetical protein